MSDCERDEFDIVPDSLESQIFNIIDSYMYFDAEKMSDDEIYSMIAEDLIKDWEKEEILEAIKFWRTCR